MVLAGENPASKVYVQKKVEACKEVEIESVVKHHPDLREDEKLKSILQDLNEDPQIHGVLIQLPLPETLSFQVVRSFLSPLKDVDCLTEENAGLLWFGSPRVKPCTPKGILRLLKEHKISLEGKNCAVVGRSHIVGLPMAQLLTQENATVTLCHSHTKNLKEHILKAEVVVVAAGKKHLLGKKDFQEKAVVVDVGIHRQGKKLFGDVRFEEVKDWVYGISPVPGGVGPMTVASLLENTLDLAEIQEG